MNATRLIVGCAAVLAGASAGASAAPLAPMPQILPIPHVGPLAPSGSSNAPAREPSGPPSKPLPDCPAVHGAKFTAPPVKLARLRIRHLVNSFRKNMFGIAAGGVIQKESCDALTRDLNDVANAHARWLRIDINWAEIQDGGRSQYDWRRIDRVAKVATAAGLRVLGGIFYTPWWARPRSTTATYGPDPSTYATFAAAAARHYSRLGVHAYEIWNEPNSPAFWTPTPNPAAYTALLKAAYVAIKRADPSATVLTGGTAPEPTGPTSYSPVDFLNGIYAAGGKGFFDAVAHHPYCWPALPGAKQPWSPWYQMYGTAPSLRSVMIANGDGAKKIWATEFGAPTDGPIGSFVNAGTQANALTKAYKLFAGYRWAGPLFFFEGRDVGKSVSTNQNFFGLMTYDFSPKPSYAAYASISRAIARFVNRRAERLAWRKRHKRCSVHRHRLGACSRLRRSR